MADGDNIGGAPAEAESASETPTMEQLTATPPSAIRDTDRVIYPNPEFLTGAVRREPQDDDVVCPICQHRFQP